MQDTRIRHKWTNRQLQEIVKLRRNGMSFQMIASKIHNIPVFYNTVKITPNAIRKALSRYLTYSIQNTLEVYNRKDSIYVPPFRILKLFYIYSTKKYLSSLLLHISHKSTLVAKLTYVNRVRAKVLGLPILKLKIC